MMKKEKFIQDLQETPTLFGGNIIPYVDLKSYSVLPMKSLQFTTQCALFNYQIWKPQSASFGCFLTIYLEINESCTAVY